MSIGKQVKEALTNAVENGYPHDYMKDPINYVEEIANLSGIEGFDINDADHVYIAAKNVEFWRMENNHLYRLSRQ